MRNISRNFNSETEKNTFENFIGWIGYSYWSEYYLILYPEVYLINLGIPLFQPLITFKIVYSGVR